MIATGLRADGHREVLGVDVGDSENETFWTEFLRSLVDRNLHGVRLVVSDAHAGLKAAIRRVFQNAGWQRCRVHAMRNLLAVAKHQQRPIVAALIRTIFAQPDPEGARDQLRAVVDQLEPVAPEVARKLEAAEDDLLAYSAFPQAHRSKIWSNNPIERLSSQPRTETAHRRRSDLPQRRVCNPARRRLACRGQRRNDLLRPPLHRRRIHSRHHHRTGGIDSLTPSSTPNLKTTGVVRQLVRATFGRLRHLVGTTLAPAERDHL